MKKNRCFVVDDEELARKDLIALLSKLDNIQIVGEAANISETIDFLSVNSVDVIFLDIQLQGETGFDLLDKIDTSINVIFVTAYDTYAIQAFEINALDYLLKPINPDRLKKSIERLNPISLEETELKYDKLNYEDSIFLNFHNKYTFLKISNIVAITSAGDYSELFTIRGEKGLTTKALKEWETRLPERRFLRIHRTTIINTDYIERIEDWFNYSYKVFMKGIANPYIMSRRYAMKIKDRI